MGFHFHIHWPHINIGKVLSKVERDVGQALGHLEKDVAKVLSKAEQMGHGLAEGLKFLAHEIATGLRVPLHILQKLVAAMAEEILQLRPLRPNESQVAQPIFIHTVPLHHVLLSPLSGASSRPFTLPGTMVLSITGLAGLVIPGVGEIDELLVGTELLAGLQNKYVIFFGPKGYHNALNHPFDQESAYPFPGESLIHELTHVWQGHNRAFAWDYVYHSVKDQCIMGTSAAYSYNVTNNPPWNSLHVEAQARVVQNWFANRSPTSGTLFCYVRDNIRQAAPNGPTNFNLAGGPALVDNG